MKHLNKFISFLLIICMLAPVFSIGVNAAENESQDELTWNLNDEGTLTISGEGSMPDYLKRSDVPWVEQKDSITSVAIEDGVTSVSQYAFCDCPFLEDVVLPDSIESIGSEAFYGTAIKEILIPAATNYISQTAFANTKLETIIVEEGNEKYWVNNYSLCTVDTYENKDYVFLHTYPIMRSEKEYVVPDDVEIIAIGAFAYAKNLEKIVFPEKLYGLATLSFLSCSNLKELKFLGDHPLVSADPSAFDADCDATVYYPGNNETWNIGLDWYNNMTFVAYHEILEEVNVSLGDTYEVRIDEDISTFESVYIDEQLINPNNYTVTEGSTIVTLKKSYLASLEAGKHTMLVKFENSVATSTFVLDAAEKLANGTCGDNLFWNLYKDGMIYIYGEGDMITSPNNIPWSEYKDRITSLVVEEGVTSIGRTAFEDYSLLTDISLPSGLKSIEYSAFYGTAIKEIVIPASVSYISPGAFPNTKLETIIVEEGNEKYWVNNYSLCTVDTYEDKNYVFLHTYPNMRSEKEYVVPDDVEIIGIGAFAYAKNLEKIVFPEKIYGLATLSFLSCSNLKELKFFGDHPLVSADPSAFDADCDATVYYPGNNETWNTSLDWYNNMSFVACYDIIDEEDGEIVIGNGNTYEVHVDADIEDFENVYVNGQLVDPDNYTVTEGSTIITFKEEFLASLGDGEYIITVEFKNGVAETTVVLDYVEPEPEEKPEIKPEKPSKPSGGNWFKDFFDKIFNQNKPEKPNKPQLPQLNSIVTIIKKIICWWK